MVDIARETSELAAKARDGKLGPADLSDAPEVAILGACKADIHPVWTVRRSCRG